MTRHKLIALGLLWALSMVLFFGLGFAAGGSSAGRGEEERPSARTYYESLNLSTPEEAVHEFCAAFRRRDYATLYMVLSPDAQFIATQRMLLLR